MKKLWYDKSAKTWNQALPIGNGRLGAMVFGAPIYDKLQINEETLWSGSPDVDTAHYDASFVNEVRELVKSRRYDKADEKIKSVLTGKETAAYLTYGYLDIDIIAEKGDVQDYTRELNLENAVATTRFLLDENKIEKSAFVSLSDDVIVYRIKSEQKISVRVSTACELRHSLSVNEDTVTIDGLCPTYVSVYRRELRYDDNIESVPFCSMLKAIPISGDIKIYGGASLRVVGSDFMLLFSLKTGFNGYDKQPISQGKEFKNSCRECLENASSFGYRELLQRHENEYKKYFDRVSFELEGEDFCEPTDVRIKKAGEGRVDNKLVTLLFDYARFLAICSNGIGTQPTNLQGIWNDELTPLWRCNYTLNINLQMNYWPINAFDMPEFNLPLFAFIRSLKERGNRFGLRGWAPFHNSDIWCDNGVKSSFPRCSWWVTGGAWLCRHIWEHYAHTRDKKFLEENYDILVSQAEFLQDYMTEKDGELIVSPSTSPENTFIFNGKKCGVAEWTASDQGICIDFFDKLIKVCEILDKDSSEYKSILEKIKPVTLASDGRILEWNEEFEEDDKGHRHISPLYGVYPADSLIGPEYSEAIRKTLDARIGGAREQYDQKNGEAFNCGMIGWSCAWLACIYARLGDAEAFSKQIRTFFKNCTYDNLFSVCTIFQIEANFGIAAAIIEALVQSHEGKVVTLPSIPKEWTHGEFTGIVARNGEKISVKW